MTPAFRKSFTALEMTADVFPWDPV
jgi:hypothetical protein